MSSQNDNRSKTIKSEIDNNSIENTNSKTNSKENTNLEDEFFLGKYKHRKKKAKTEENFPIVLSSGHSFEHKSSHKHHNHRRKKKMKRWKKITISVSCVVLGLIAVLASTLAILVNDGGQQMIPSDYSVTAPSGVTVDNDGEQVLYNGKAYEINKSITTVLCIGVDQYDLDNPENEASSGQADAILLCAIDTSTGKTTIINVSREILVDVDTFSREGTFQGTKKQHICLSYAYGDGKETSCENTVTSVRRLFYNFPIKSYFALDLDGISAINDSVGGVDVVSPETIGNFTEGEAYHLMGKEAELFVRRRDISQIESNNKRNERQQVYIKSFMETAIEQTKQDITTPIKLFNASSDYSCTNLNASTISYLATNIVASGGMSVKMQSVPGKVKMGDEYAEYDVDEEKFYEMFLNIFYKPVN